MARTSRTIADLINLVRYEIDESSTQRHTDDRIREALNEGRLAMVLDLAVEAQPELRDTLNLNIVNGIAYVSLPDSSNVARIVAVSVNYGAGGGSVRATFVHEANRALADWMDLYRGVTTHPIAWREGNAIYISPTPTVSVANGVSVDYIQSPTLWTSDTSTSTTPEMPDNATPALVHYAAYSRQLSVRDENRAAIHKQMYDAKINAINALYMEERYPNLPVVRALGARS